MASYLARRRSASSTSEPTGRTASATGTPIDPALVPRHRRRHTGDQFAISQQADSAYKRLTRTITVPAGGGTLSFWVNRDTEEDWDYFFVEAHTAGETTGRRCPISTATPTTTPAPSCPFWLEDASVPCPLPDRQPATAPATPTGHDRRLVRGSAARSGGWEQWTVDLSRCAGSDVEVSLSLRQRRPSSAPACTSTTSSCRPAEGTTSFEDDGDTSTAGRSLAPPAGSPGNENEWKVGTSADLPPRASARWRWLVRPPAGDPRLPPRHFGRYPFDDAGGIVDDVAGRLRAREPDAADLLAGFFDRATRVDLRRRPRARAPVVRRQPGRRSAGSTSG